MRQAWVVFLSGNMTAASKLPHAGKNALAALPEGEEKGLLYGHLSAMHAAIIALTHDTPGAFFGAQEALKFLPVEAFIYRACATSSVGLDGSEGYKDQYLDLLSNIYEFHLISATQLLFLFRYRMQ